MRSAAAAPAALAVLAAASALVPALARGAQPAGGPAPVKQSAADDNLTIKLSTHRAGAKRVTLTLAYPAAIRCGRPSLGAAVHVPVTAGLPSTIRVGDVRMNTYAVASARVRKHVLTVGAPRSGGMVCDSIRIGTVTLVVSAAAQLSNPAQAGRYTITVAAGTETHSATYSIGS